MQRRLVPCVVGYGEVNMPGYVDEPVLDTRPPLAHISSRYLKQSTANFFADGVDVLSPKEEWFLPEFDPFGNRVVSRSDRIKSLCFTEFADLCEQVDEARAEDQMCFGVIFQRPNKPLIVISFRLEGFPDKDMLREKIFIGKNGHVFFQAFADSHRSAGFYLRDEISEFIRHFGENVI